MEKKGAGGAVLRALVTLVIIAISIYAGFQVKTYLDERNKPQLEASYVSGKIEEASELTTAKMIYNGLVKFQDGDIPFLTQKAFVMIYKAEIRAGIDVSKIEVEVTDEQVILYMPDVEILSIDVDPDSIEFYDTKRALLKWSKKEDVRDALKEARTAAKESADMESLKEEAKKQAETVLTGLLKDTVGEREIVFAYGGKPAAATTDATAGDEASTGEAAEGEDAGTAEGEAASEENAQG